MEELEYSLQFEEQADGSLHTDPVGGALLFDGEIVELMSAGVKSISVNGIPTEADANQNVDIPMDETIAAYLRENLGTGLKLEGTRLCVDAARAAEKDNTAPITSAAVYTELGNINILLKTI